MALAAEGGDFSLDLTAAAPFTYDHTIGGGAYNVRDVGKSDDIVESLEGSDFSCGDTVTYLTQITVDAGAIGTQTIEIDYEFLADTTGQSGAALSDILGVSVNYGCVINGATPDGACDGSATPSPEGLDSGISDDGGSTALLTHEALTGPLFVSKSVLEGTVQISDLEASETVVVRTDVRLACEPGSSPTGNLQAAIVDARAILPTPLDSIRVGNQTVPFLHIGDLGFAELSVIKTVTEENGTCPGVEVLAIAEGDTVKYCYEVSNVGTQPVYNLDLVDDNGTPGDVGDDFAITISSGLTDEVPDGSANDLAAGGTAYGSALVEITTAFGGSLTNIVYANGEPVEQENDDATVTVTLARGMLIEKRAVLASVADPQWADCADPISAASGEDVVFCYKITNTGDVDLYNVTDVLDDNATVGVPGDDFYATISGLLDLDADTVADDLGSGAIAYAFSSPISMDFAAPHERTNVATVDADDVDPQQDTAVVNVTRPPGQCSMDVTISTDGNCPAGEEVFILADTEVTWCVSVHNGIQADLATIIPSYTTDGGSTYTEMGDLGPLASGGDASAQFNQVIPDDTTLEATAVATDVYGNVYTCAEDDAKANVVHPSLNIVKTVVVAADGDCANSTDPLNVVGGTEVNYCYEVTNNGDTNLVDIDINDDILGYIGNIAELAIGATATVKSSAVVITVDIENTGTANGTDEYGYPVSDNDIADVYARYADIVVEKSGPSTVIATGDKSIVYNITVSNTGDTTAINVVLTDPMPEGFIFDADGVDPLCLSDGGTPPSVSCNLGDIAPAGSVVLSFSGSTTLANGSMLNEACAVTDTPEIYTDNNCDDTTTRIVPGATRTIGFWGNHPDYMEMCLEASNWQVDLGFYAMDASGDALLQEQMLKDSIGIIKTNIAKNTCGDHRDKVQKVQLQSGRQVLAAYCNVTLLGGGFDGFEGYNDFDTFLQEWLDALAAEDTHTMLTLGGIADEFNNSGDDIPLDGDPGPANPHFEWTDPTSPETCPTSKGKSKSKGTGSGGCTIGNGSGVDPLLPLMVLVAAVYLWRRRERKV
ncbi:MAG: JDVT-CTERM domain-containing protein [Pseudomonadota bacterium]